MDKNEILQFGQWVKAQRQKLGITQGELADELGVAKGSISAIEIGAAKTVGPKMAKKIRDFFFHKSNGENESFTSLPPMDLTMLMPIIKLMASLVTSPTWETKLTTIQDTLNCTREEAAITIILNEIQKKK